MTNLGIVPFDPPPNKPMKRRVRKPLPHYLNEQEVQSILTHAHSPDARLVILIMWRAGLRVSEALDLTPADCNLSPNDPSLHVRHGKGDRERYVPMHQELRAALELILHYAPKTATKPLVQANRATVYRWVMSAYGQAVDAGAMMAGKKVHPHIFRHSAARHWFANGIGLNEIQLWLGHEHLSTTAIYAKLSPGASSRMGQVP